MEPNYRMFELAREIRGLSQAQLVNDLDNVSQSTYSRIEKGIISPTTEQIDEISKKLNFAITFFYKEYTPVNYQEYYYRKKQSLPVKEQKKLEAYFDLLRITFENLLDEVSIPDFTFPEIEIEHTNTPEQVALTIRRIIGIDKGPIQDLVRRIEKRGVVVYFLKANNKFDGTTIITKSGVRIIVVNDSMPNYRKRFTICHELCHILCHIPFTNFSPFKDDVESQANSFASEMLMPSSEIINDLYNLTYNCLADLKNYWKVSKAALIYKAKSTKAIDQNRFIYLMTELSRYGERKSEINDVTLDEPILLNLMVTNLKGELMYDDADLMSNLGLSVPDYYELILKKKVGLRIAI